MKKNTSANTFNQHNTIEFSRTHRLSHPLLAIVGPTASGKSDLAMALAERIQSSILCVDSMQVYRGLDVGTAKPTPEQRSRVPHYGLDLVSPLESFNASKFAEYGEPLVQQAVESQTPLILCGGTGLYFRALLEGFFETPAPDPQIRDALKSKRDTFGSEALYHELLQVDPQSAHSIHPNDTKRVIRALEIIQQTGCTLSQLHANQIFKPWIKQTFFLGLKHPKEILNRRIQLRTKEMYDNGIIKETQWLLQLGCSEKHTAFQALGYKECAEYLKGRISFDEALALTEKHTRQYAKRQMTWFRRQFETHWLDLSKCKEYNEMVNESLHVWENGGNNTL